MSTTGQKIAAGFAAFQKGDYGNARKILSGIKHPQALHILGLSEKRLENYDRAAQLLDKAARLDPKNHEIANNQGLNARAMGDMDAAKLHFQRALRLKPDFLSAAKSLGRTLTDLKEWEAAAEMYRAAGMLAPGDSTIVYGRALCALELGNAETCEAALTPLIQNDPQAHYYFIRGRARLEMDDMEGGTADLEASWQMRPDALILKTLAGTYWMQGMRNRFDQLLQAAPYELNLTVIDLIRESGNHEEALTRWAGMDRALQATPDALALKALIKRERGDGPGALEAALAAHKQAPDTPGIADMLIAAHLMCGDAEKALTQARRMRALQPLAQHWIAHEAQALALLAEPIADELLDVERLVRAYELPVPDGYESLEAFNADFVEALARHRRYITHPLDQSLRNGAQTVRDLTAIDEPAIKAYVAALDAPIRQYLAEIGRAQDHPLTARNTGNYRFNGMWSVALAGQGYHVNHVHPEGWVSSAYYAAVPDETLGGQTRAGWIKFGEPPFATLPPSAPLKWVQPKPGLLVLFPSYMWHGTEPISKAALRVTAPFDLLPK